MPTIIDREELAWAAGWFEGEGSVGGHQVRSRTPKNPVPWNQRPVKWAVPRLSMRNTELSQLRRFKLAVGGLGNIRGPFKPHPRTFGKKPYYRYAVTNYEDVQAVVAMLGGFMTGQKKQEMYERFLKYHEDWTANGGRPGRWAKGRRESRSL